MDKIVILDFGGQTTQLIGRRIRDKGVFTDIYHGEITLEELDLTDVKGIILSGSPYSVYEEGAPEPDYRIFDLGLPILGICYGFQRINTFFGGKVESLSTKEYGRAPVQLLKKNPLFQDIKDGFLSWMSHGDSISEVAPGFELLGVSEHHPAAVYNSEKNIYAIQFHPETSHCEQGFDILGNFALKICKANPEWNMDKYIELECNKIRQKVGDKSVLLLISGGVDSTVAGGLLLKALPSKQVHLMYIDTGLMRKNESEEVANNLKMLGAENLYLINAEDRFLSPLSGIEDPEAKRKIIGDMFIKVQEEEVLRNQIPSDAFLAQGTLYTDLIESGKGVGKKAQVIKSHHNVGSPLVEAKRNAGLIIEPLEMLYKDEVRQLGAILGLNKEVVHRHPFPGPGLGIRVLGEVSKEKCDILREADWIYINELRKRKLYDKIWQAFAVLLPVRSVGVTGDARDYSFVLALRAVTSSDGMSADVYDFPTKDLLEISNMITNSVKEVGRVVYDISSKPPSTIEWE
ncbi:glutamine-hydrolyzing GMP synthase [Spirochaeta cellobiosiphila]|uniref:glutamine-hydrolyzing GMP synthase n=1 Tax=Spirochaeta cellobiosiphila TaxID=504483 RepID=UPI0003F94C10|nr:glutamine-hydrolyzing GMP synthase [Spirochaeta cellobiosiphila]